MTSGRLRGMTTGVIGALAAIALAPAAWAQAAPLDMSIRDTRLAPDGVTEIIVNVTGDTVPDVLEADAFTVAEGGTPVELEVTPLLGSGAVQVGVSLAIDASGSMEGEPMELTIEAAVSLAQQLTQQGVMMQVVSFASSIDVLTPLTDDTDALVAAIEGIEAGGATPLYDAIVVAAEGLDGFEGQRNLIVFGDGGDTSSEASIDEAITAAAAVEAPVVTVALDTPDIDMQALEAVTAGTEGSLLTAADANEIAAVFDTVAGNIASQYVLRYQGEPTELTDIQLAVGVAAGEEADEVRYSVANTREAAPAEAAAPRIIESSPPGLFASQGLLYAGIGAAFLALLVIFGMILTAHRTRAERVLSDQLAAYLDGRDARAGRSSDVAAYFRSRAMAFLEATPRPRSLDDKLTVRLEQAAWLMRPGEFIALCLLSTLATGLVVGVAFNWFGGFLAGALAGLIPVAILSRRRSKRQDAFLRALPDTLQLMAGSLRAGYGVLQAIDTVAKEGQHPVDQEFNRVLTEARLGMPIEDALQDTADRIDSDDFRWVVLAVNIQREVGGNLAELLDLVADVLREREMLRRQIKVLSAEGRLSAIVLIALPIFLTLYLTLARPEYVGTLVTSGLFGWVLVGGGAFLMVVGVIWIRNLIRIEV